MMFGFFKSKVKAHFDRKPEALPVTPKEVNYYCAPVDIFCFSGSRSQLNYAVRIARGDDIAFDPTDIGKPPYELRDFGPGAKVVE